ncbi:MAG: MFS transporter, partial [Ignavibacteriales bacterium]
MNPWRGLKNLPKNMWILFFTTLINRTGTMVLPFLTIYLTRKIGITAGDAGIVLAVYGAGAMITSPFTGKLSDRKGSLFVMKLSLILSGIILLFFPFIENYFLILAITLLWSFINEAFRPANLSLISEVVLPEKRRTAFALNRLAINLGMSIGPVAGGFLTLIDFSFLFYANGLTSILAGIFLVASPWQPENTEEKISHQDAVDLKHSGILRDKAYLYFLISIIPVQIVFFQHIGAMPIYVVSELGFSTAVFGLLAIINTVLIIFIEVPLNESITGWSFKKSLMLGSLLCGIGFGSMAFSRDIPLLAMTIIIWTFGEMIFFPISAAYVSEIAPKKKMGEYMGFYQMTFSIAFMLGPWLGTEVLEHLGSVTLWIFTFSLGALSAFMMLRI